MVNSCIMAIRRAAARTNTICNMLGNKLKITSCKNVYCIQYPVDIGNCSSSPTGK